MIDINITHGKNSFNVSIEKKYITDLELIRNSLNKLVIDRLRHKTTPEELDHMITMVLEEFEEQIKEL